MAATFNAPFASCLVVCSRATMRFSVSPDTVAGLLGLAENELLWWQNQNAARTKFPFCPPRLPLDCRIVDCPVVLTAFAEQMRSP